MAAATRSFANKHSSLYASERDCQRYDADLCQHQDYQGALLAAILEVLGASLSATTIRALDAGAGTGKLSRLLAPHVSSLVVTDRSAEALAVARSSLESGRAGHHSCTLAFHQSDLRTLPLPDGSVDLVIAGWAVSYLKSEHEEWYADGSSGGPWREEVDRAMAEFDRVLAPGGALILLETKGTATASPQRAGSWFYAHLREAHAMHERTIRTDYRFPSRCEALETLLFFFGKGVASRAQSILADVPPSGVSCIVPECTGLWWRHKWAAPAPLGRVHASKWLTRTTVLAVVTLLGGMAFGFAMGLHPMRIRRRAIR